MSSSADDLAALSAPAGTVTFDDPVPAPSPLEAPAVRPTKYDRALDRIEAEERMRLQGVIYAAQDQEPDHVASVQQFAKQLGVPPRAVPDDAKLLRTMVRQKLVRDLGKTAPATAAKLLDFEFALIAQDQIPQVSAIEKVWQGAREQVSDFADATSGSFSEFSSTGRGDLMMKVRAGTATPAEVAENARLREENAALLQGRSFGAAAGQFVGQMAANTLDAARDASMVAIPVAVSSLAFPPAELAVIPAFATTMKASFAARMIGQAAAMSREKMLDEGIDPEAAQHLSFGVGLTVGALEMVGLKYVGGSLRPTLTNALAGRVTEKMAEASTREVMVEFGKRYATGMAGETTTEILQQVAEITGAEVGRKYSNLPMLIETPEGRARIADELADVAVTTLKGMAVLGGIGSGVGVSVDRMEARRAKRAAQLHDDAAERVAGTKLLERNPDALSDVVTAQGAANGVDSAFIRAEAFAQLIEEGKVPIDSLEEKMPGIRAKLEKALREDGDIRLAVGDYFTHMSTDPALGPKLKDHVRWREEDASLFDAERREKMAEKFASAQKAANRDISEQDKAVRKLVRDQVAADKRLTRTQVDTTTGLVSSVISNTARRVGMTPQELLAEFPLQTRTEAAVPQDRREIFSQDQRQDAVVRGTFDPTSWVISIFKDSNPATFLHEFAHWQLEVHGKLAERVGPEIQSLAQQIAALDAAALDKEAQAELLAAAMAARKALGEDVEVPDVSKVAEAERKEIQRLDSVLSRRRTLAADFQVFLQESGVADPAAWAQMTVEQKRPHHERMASFWEQYLSEGRAPSAKLERYFRRLARILIDVYRDVRAALNQRYQDQFGEDLPEMSPEMRSLMDRWLVADDVVNRYQSRRGLVALFEDQAESGLTPEQWEAYQNLWEDDRAAAIETLVAGSERTMKWLRRSMSRMTKSLQDELKERVEAMRPAVEAQVREQPLFQLQRELREGPADMAQATAQNVLDAAPEELAAAEEFAAAVYVDREDVAALEALAAQEPRLKRTLELARDFAEADDLGEAVPGQDTFKELDRAFSGYETAVEGTRTALRDAAAGDREVAASPKDKGAKKRAQALRTLAEQAEADLAAREAKLADLFARRGLVEEVQRRAKEASEEATAKAAQAVNPLQEGTARAAEYRAASLGRIAKAASEAKVDVKPADQAKAKRVLRRRALETARGRLAELRRLVRASHTLDREAVEALVDAYARRKVTEANEAAKKRLARAQAENRHSNAEVKTDEEVDAAVGKLKKRLLGKFGVGKRAVLQNGGLDPDTFAESRGFTSGQAMIEALIEAPTFKQAVDNQIAKALIVAYGDEMQNGVDRAIHNDARSRFAALELALLQKSEAAANVKAAAKMAAERKVARLTLEEVRKNKFRLEEARASREAAYALRARPDKDSAQDFVAPGVASPEFRLGQVEQAIGHKQEQVLKGAMAAEAVRVKVEVEKFRDLAKKFSRADTQLAKTHDMDVIDVGRALLSTHGFGRADKTFAEHVTKVQQFDPIKLSGLLDMTEQALAFANKPFDTLTVDEFRTLDHVITTLWESAASSRKVQLGDEAQQIEEVRAKFGDSIVAVADKRGIKPVTSIFRKIRNVSVHADRMLQWASEWDGVAGPGKQFALQYIFRPVHKRFNEYLGHRRAKVIELEALVSQLDLTPRKIDVLRYVGGAKLTVFGEKDGNGRAELLGALLHYGNWSNWSRVARSYGWATVDENGNIDMSRAENMVQGLVSEGVLTKKDFEILQKIGDSMEELQPLEQRAFRAMYGRFFDTIEIRPIETPFGPMRGWYAPLAIDKERSLDATRRQKLEDKEQYAGRMWPAPPTGQTKARVEDYIEPVLLDIRLALKSYDDKLRLAYMGPVTRDVMRVVNGRDVRSQMRLVDDQAIDNLIVRWLQAAAQNQQSEPGKSPVVDAVLRRLKLNTTIARMGLNVLNSLVQTTGFASTAVLVEPKFIRSAALDVLRDRKSAYEFAKANSKVMAQKLDEEANRAAYLLEEQLGSPDLINWKGTGRVQRWVALHAQFLQSLTQGRVDVVTWSAAYRQAAAAPENAKLSDIARHEAAVVAADEIVLRTQGGSRSIDKSNVERGTPFVQLFTHLTGFGMNQFLLLKTEAVAAMHQKTGTSRAKRIALVVLYGHVVTALLNEMVMSLGRGDPPWNDDDGDGLDVEELLAWFVRANVKQGASYAGPATGMVNAVLAAFTDDPMDDRLSLSPGLTTAAQATAGTVKAISNAIQDDKDVTGKNIRDVLLMSDLVTGLGLSSFPGRPLSYGYDVARGAVEPSSLFDAARGAVTGTAAKDTKRRAP